MIVPLRSFDVKEFDESSLITLAQQAWKKFQGKIKRLALQRDGAGEGLIGARRERTEENTGLFL